MKTNIKLFYPLLSLCIAFLGLSSAYAANFDFGYRSPGTYSFSDEGENNVTVCNNVRCASTTYRIDKTPPAITTSWLQSEINFDTAMEIHAKDNISMIGGSLTVTENSNKFDIQPAIILGKEAIVNITVKPEFINEIFTADFSVQAKDHMGLTSTMQSGVFSIHYDGQGPTIDVSANNQESTEQGFIPSVYANSHSKVRIADGAQEAEITDNYGFLVDVEENNNIANADQQTGIYELSYRYSIDPNYYPTELPDSIQESSIQNIGLTESQANTLWEKKDPANTFIQFKAKHKRELLETCTKLGLNDTQKGKILSLWGTIWKENFYKVPAKNSTLEAFILEQQAKVNTYIQLPETGKVLLEIQAVDKAGNIESKIYNVHLDTRPLVQVSPLEWVNLSKGETINVNILDKSDINPFYTDNTYHFVFKPYNNGTLGAEELKISSAKKQLILGDELKSLPKGVYGLEISYTDASGYQSSQFAGNIYIDNTEVVKPEDLTYSLTKASVKSASLNGIIPPEKACNSNPSTNNVTKNGIKKVFANCIPEFDIQKTSDSNGRSDVISYNITQLAKMNDQNEVESYRSEKSDPNSTLSGVLNLLVFDTHDSASKTEFSEDEMISLDGISTQKDILMASTKDAVANEAQSLYQQKIMEPLINTISTSENSGAEIFAEAIDPLEAQKKVIQTSVNNGFSEIHDSKGNLQISTLDVKPVSFLGSIAQKKYTHSLVQLENFLQKNRKTELTIKALQQDLYSIETEINKIQSQNQEFLNQILPKKDQHNLLLEVLKNLKQEEKILYAEFSPYMGVEQLLYNAEISLPTAFHRHQAEMRDLLSKERSLPGIIAYDKWYLSVLENNWWYQLFFQGQIAILRQSIASNEAYLASIPRLKQELPQKFALEKATLENQIRKYQQDIIVKRGLEEKLRGKQGEITAKVAEIDALNKEITELENVLLNSINSIALNELKKEKQFITSKIQKENKIVLRNESFIENAKRNLFALGKQLEQSNENILADINNIYNNLEMVQDPIVTTTQVASIAAVSMDPENTFENKNTQEEENNSMQISSSAFQDSAAIPVKYTCDGQNINPPLSIKNVPPETKSITLLFEASSGAVSLWNVWNINPQTYSILENSIPSGGLQGRNINKTTMYTGPCPTTPGEVQFVLYALDTRLDIPEGTDKATLLSAMEGHILEQATLKANYDRTLQIQEKQLKQELSTLTNTFSQSDSQKTQEITQVTENITQTTQSQQKVISALNKAKIEKNELLEQRAEIEAQENIQNDIEDSSFLENVVNTITETFTSSVSLEEIDGKIAQLDAQIVTYQKEYTSITENIAQLTTEKESLESKKAIATEEYNTQKAALENQLQSTQQAIQEKIQAEEGQNSQASTGEKFIGFINAVLGIQSSYAASLPEGVYELPDGTQVIIDLTNPTGSISALTENGGNASKDPTSGWVYKPGENQKLGLKKNDNFENYGSFKSWKVEGRKGSHPKDMVTTCNGYGAYKLIDQSSNYADPIYGEQNIEDKALATTNVWGECFEYRLTVEDESGHIITKQSEVVYTDGIIPKLDSFDIKDIAGADMKKIDLASKESPKNLTLSWNFKDDESGLASVTRTVKFTGIDGNTTTEAPVTVNATDSYTTNLGEGDYEVTMIATDRAGNTLTKTFILVYKIIMNEANSTVSFDPATCNQWKADATSTCKVTATILNVDSLPLENFPVKIQGYSDAALDQVHYPVRDGSNHAQESVFFEGESNNTTVGKNFTTDTSGKTTFSLITYAPTIAAGTKIDFTFTDLYNHNPNPNPAYTPISKNGYDYSVDNTLSAIWNTAPTFFQKNATKEFSLNINNSTANATDERIGLYIFNKLTGAYSITNMDTTAPREENSTIWVQGNNETEKSNAKNTLSIINYGYDTSVIYSVLQANGTYTYKTRFSKNSGVQNFDTSVDISPFARMTLKGKEIAYPLTFLNKKNIPLYNQATETQGNGLVQSSIGKASQDKNSQGNSSSDASKDSAGSISIQALTSDLKEKVKKQILNLKSQASDQIIRSLTSFDAGVEKINNGRTYVVKGDNADLIIDANSGTFELGDTPVTFVTYGGNIIIKSNIVYSGSKKPTVAFIALRNESTGTGGEIHVTNITSNGNPLTNIVGSYFSERGMLGLGSTVDLTAEQRQDELTHQLVIEGSIMGSNTLGGGDSPYSCPSFIRKSSCTELNAQKYDINYLRRFVPTGDADHSPASGAGSDKPVIIKYYMNRELLPTELQ